MPSKEKKAKKNTDIPQTEIELRELQDLYLKNKGDKEITGKYFMLLRTYARSIALKVIKRKGIFLPPERVDEISTDATLLMMRQYDKDGWSVSVSFAGILIWKVYEAMYSCANDEMNSSLNFTFSDDSDSKELMDIIGSNASMPWDGGSEKSDIEVIDNPANSIVDNTNVAFNEIVGVIDEAYEILPYKTFMRFVPWLVLQFRKPKTRNIGSLYNNLFLSNREENAFDLLLLEIHNRIRQHAF